MENDDLGDVFANRVLNQPIDDGEALHSTRSFENEERSSLRDVEKRAIDQFGLPVYRSRYPQGGSSDNNASEAPLHEHAKHPNKRCTTFDIFRSRQFWRQVEFAFRITIIGALLPAALIAAELPNSPFVSTVFTLTSVALGARLSVGENVSYLFAWIRAGCLWLPIATIGGSIYLDKNIAAWCVYYTVFLFVLAALTTGIARRNCLLLFNNCMIGILSKPESVVIYPSRVMVDWCIGLGLCLFAAFFPYPIFCKDVSHRTLSDISKKLGASFTASTSCFWADSNVERNMAISNVRIINVAIDNLLEKFHTQQELSFFEFIFEGSNVRYTRDAKGKLFERLRSNLRGLSRVLDIVETKPWVFDDSERSKAFGKVLKPHIKKLATLVEELTDLLGDCTSFRVLKSKHLHFIEIHRCAVKLQHEFTYARRTLFYEHLSDTMEEFVPLMTFYIFSLINFCDTLVRFDYDVNGTKMTWKKSTKSVFTKAFYKPVKDTIVYLKQLGTSWRRREIQRLIEAAKVSLAMITTVGFSYLIGIDVASLSGPGIIAFVSGSNPVEAVQASLIRLTACIMGTVLGFFAGSYSNTKIEKVATICVFFFITSFLRYDKEYGIIAVYGTVVLIPLVTISTTSIEGTIQRMNEITFGIFIYLFISILVFPLSPSLILRKKRINILFKMSEAITQINSLFEEPLPMDSMCLNSITRVGNEPDNIEELFGNNSLAIRSIALPNMNTGVIFRPDPVMEKIDAQLNEIETRLKSTYAFMGFASRERGLIDVGYPVKACEKTSFHLYRMICLLRTMWCSWDVLRTQHSYSQETLDMLRALHPIACDASRWFGEFVDLLCCELRSPATCHKSELVRVLLEFVQTVEELHLRKNYIFLRVVRAAAEGHRQRRSGGRPEPAQRPPRDRQPRPRPASILPLLRKGTKASMLDESSSSLPEPLSLSESFILPITGEDIEGLHSFTLGMQMFADEARQIFMSFEEMIAHMRKHS